jgi:hypothetical protein
MANDTESLRAAFANIRKLDAAIDAKLNERFLMALVDTTKWELEELRRKRAEAEARFRCVAGNIVTFPTRRRCKEFAEAG